MWCFFQTVNDKKNIVNCQNSFGFLSTVIWNFSKLLWFVCCKLNILNFYPKVINFHWQIIYISQTNSRDWRFKEWKIIKILIYNVYAGPRHVVRGAGDRTQPHQAHEQTAQQQGVSGDHGDGARQHTPGVLLRLQERFGAAPVQHDREGLCGA